MDEELRDNLEKQGEENMSTCEASAEAVTEDAVPEEAVTDEVMTEEAVYTEPVIDIQAQEQPESVLEQAEDGSWRHAENSPFSPFYVPDRKQAKNNRITIALVALLLLLLVSGLIFAVSKLVEAAMGEAKTAWNEGSHALSEFWSDFKEEFEEELEADLQEELPEEFNSDDFNMDEFDSKEWEDFFEQFEGAEEYDEYDENGDYVTEDGFHYVDGMYQATPEDDYYLELTDSIREDLSYSVSFEDYEVNDINNNVSIWVQYAQIEGDAPYVDDINQYLKDGAMFYAEKFNDMDATDLTLSVATYVTYMDEELLSVVVDERYHYQGDGKYNLYCMNFDLTTGTYLYNTDIIEASDELVKAFKKQSDYQNGELSAVHQFSDEEIRDFMSEEETLILYYTPVGLEVGYMYPDGWISITLKDYEKYLKSL